MNDAVDVPDEQYWISSYEHFSDEAPARIVIVADPFAIDRTPVTNAPLAAFLDATSSVMTTKTLPRIEDYISADHKAAKQLAPTES